MLVGLSDRVSDITLWFLINTMEGEFLLSAILESRNPEAAVAVRQFLLKGGLVRASELA